MKVLYIGGTGEISLACVKAGVASGHEVTVFNRGRGDEPLPDEVTTITGDINDTAAYAGLGDGGFDVVCQFMAFDVDRIETDIKVFGGRVKQYVFISSASAYEKPPRRHVITEQTPLVNPFWEYSAKKAAMEQRLFQAHEAGEIAATVVRPSHTYRRRFPAGLGGGDVVAWRMRQGRPIIVHGDGTSLWTVTHASDFARAFVKLLGNDAAMGEAFHITHDDQWTWRQIYEAIGQALGVEPELVCVPTDTLVRYNAQWNGPLWGDKANPVVFDNSKVKRIAGDFACEVDMRRGMKMVAEHWPQRAADYEPDEKLHTLMDRIAAEQGQLGG